MKNTAEAVDYVMETYYRMHDEEELSWDECKFTLPLMRPYPDSYSVIVKPYCDYYDEDNHFDVHISDGELYIVSCSSEENSAEDLECALYHAFQQLCWYPWPDYAAEYAWNEFKKIPLDSDGNLLENFLCFRKGENKREVQSKFDIIYRLGITALMDPPAEDEQLQMFEIPVEWTMRGTVKIPARNLESALSYLQSPYFKLPKGNFIAGSVAPDTSSFTVKPIGR